ncbi:flavin reductase [Kocuria kalidii]|uniref:flavin reductase family protein n=1 Tax=Kocuria kalidii TaxID=3376283 RepID=UPI0037909DEE
MTISSLSAATTTVGGELFKDAFRAHPAGVAVVTAAGPDGPVGLTASSVASVSADPPALAFSVSEGRSASQLAGAGTVVVHLMGAQQLDLVRAFSTRGAPRFTDRMDWELLASGEPLLRAAPWALRCEIAHRVPVGGSVLIAATVLDVRTVAGGGEPLVYHDRAFHCLGPHSRLP